MENLALYQKTLADHFTSYLECELESYPWSFVLEFFCFLAYVAEVCFCSLGTCYCYILVIYARLQNSYQKIINLQPFIILSSTRRSSNEPR